MKCTYKVGDKVLVRSDLSEEHGASERMTELYAGKIVTIKETNAPVFGIDIGAYIIEEDKQRYRWNDDMFEALVDVAEPAPVEVKPANPMPALTTGMFGKEEDGDIFVVVGDLIVYKSGLWESVKDITNRSGYYGGENIVGLYDCKCFDEVEDGTATVLWERESKPAESEEKDEEERDVVKEFIEALEELATLLEGKGDKE